MNYKYAYSGDVNVVMLMKFIGKSNKELPNFLPEKSLNRAPSATQVFSLRGAVSGVRRVHSTLRRTSDGTVE